MTIRKIINTRHSDVITPRGKWREGIYLDLDCGHSVNRYYNCRSPYISARCEWCEAENRDGVKYVRNMMKSRQRTDAPAFIPITPPQRLR